jgi:hypothetical protein
MLIFLRVCEASYTKFFRTVMLVVFLDVGECFYLIKLSEGEGFRT